MTEMADAFPIHTANSTLLKEQCLTVQKAETIVKPVRKKHSRHKMLCNQSMLSAVHSPRKSQPAKTNIFLFTMPYQKSYPPHPVCEGRDNVCVYLTESVSGASCDSVAVGAGAHAVSCCHFPFSLKINSFPTPNVYPDSNSNEQHSTLVQSASLDSELTGQTTVYLPLYCTQYLQQDNNTPGTAECYRSLL